MAKFRKKPVVIEAVQFKYSEWADNLEFSELPEWLDEAFEKDIVRGMFESEDYWYLLIQTLEGPIKASPDDWIIKGTRGEIYPCKPGPFEDTFEPVT